MKRKQIFTILFIFFCFMSPKIFAQKKDEKNIEIYSIFNDFRIPTRENINTSDLKYDGWVSDPGMYTFRCKEGKRVRLTFWYLDKGPKEVLDSEFINVTTAIGKCQKKDIEYKKQEYRSYK